MDSGPSGRITRTERKKKTMNPERIAELKKATRKSYTQRRKRLVSIIKARIEQIEKQKIRDLGDALEIARQSRRWRNRLSKFVKLTITVRPTHVLMVNLWGKDTFFRAGTQQQMENLIEEFPSLVVAGYSIICISGMAKVLQKGELPDEA